MIVMAVEDSVICHYEECWNIHILANDKFTGDLQLSSMPHSTFIFIKLIRYFSCVIRNAPFPGRFPKINFHLATSPAPEITTATFANSFARTYTQSVLRIETLKAPLYSCQQQSISSTKLHSLIFSLNIFFKTFVLFGFPFQYSLQCLFGSCFFHAFFLQVFFVYL